MRPAHKNENGTRPGEVHADRKSSEKHLEKTSRGNFQEKKSILSNAQSVLISAKSFGSEDRDEDNAGKLDSERVTRTERNLTGAEGRVEWADRLRVALGADELLVAIYRGGTKEEALVGYAVVELDEVARCSRRSEKSLHEIVATRRSVGEKVKCRKERIGLGEIIGTLEVYGEDRIGVMRMRSRDLSELFDGGPQDISGEGCKYTLGLSTDFVERQNGLGLMESIDSVYYTVYIACAERADEKKSEEVNESKCKTSNIVSRKSSILGRRKQRIEEGRRECLIANRGAEDHEKWICVSQSKVVARVNAKSESGTTDVVYSSRLPLLSKPGSLLSDPESEEVEQRPMEKFGVTIGILPDKRELFSLPNATFATSSPRQLVKISVFNPAKRYSLAKSKLLAYSVFTKEELKIGGLGYKTNFFIPGKRDHLPAQEVGEACIIQKEHCEDPEYFGLHAVLTDLP